MEFFCLIVFEVDFVIVEVFLEFLFFEVFDEDFCGVFSFYGVIYDECLQKYVDFDIYIVICIFMMFLVCYIFVNFCVLCYFCCVFYCG